MKIIILLIRILLGLVFINYGMVKLMGGQYYYGDFVIDSRTVGGPSFVWAFFGYSKIYAYFTGVGELIAGLLLLFPRTATLGAAALFPVTLNITVMTFAFRFPGVKYLSLIFTTLCALLLWYDYRKLKLIFWDQWQVDAALAQLKEQPMLAAQAVKAPMSWAKRFALAAVVVLIFFFYLNAEALLAPGPADAALKQTVAQGWKEEDLILRRYNYTGGMLFNQQGSVWFEVKSASPPKLVRVDLHRPLSFFGWRIDRVMEESKPQK